MRFARPILLILICILISCESETVFAANYRQQASPQQAVPKKKSHKWLIPVGIGAGFAIGTLVGLSAYDDAINSDQKVWTTAILSGAAGGFAGWAVSHHLDKPSKSAFRWNPSPNPTDVRQASVDSQCFPRRGLILKHQADCLVPPYLYISTP